MIVLRREWKKEHITSFIPNIEYGAYENKQDLKCQCEIQKKQEFISDIEKNTSFANKFAQNIPFCAPYCYRQDNQFKK